ncbi:MAG: zf-HC2 domain-containing protein [Alcanivorax sp.]|nr:zf-HC2 domain-containing protein [Alcanivorax sp.]
MLKCKHAVEKADALVDGTPLGRTERLALYFHLLICHHCRRYLRQLRALLGVLPRQQDALDDGRTRAILDKLDPPQQH